MLVVITLLVVGGAVAIDRLSTEDAEAVVIDKPDLGIATVIRTDLVERETFEGTLRFRDWVLVTAQMAGTVTGAVSEESTVGRGDLLIEVDGQPVVVFIGQRPMWRPLADGVEDGEDVRQLEANLQELGYAPNGDEPFTPDEVFDETTGEMVADWRGDLGLSDESFVELGRIVYIDQPARVGEVLVEVGSVIGPGIPIVGLTGTSREVGLLLPVDRQDLVTVGDQVEVTLPTNEIVSGTVESIGRSVVSIGGPGGERAIEIVIDISAGDFDVQFDESPVDVELETNRASGVLAVPVNALLALSDGGYALQKETGDRANLVAVEIGTFVDGLVEVTGDIAEGDAVLVPK